MRRLDVRVTAIALAVMGLTLVAVSLLTYQLVLSGGRQEVDRVLRQELAELSRDLPDALGRVSDTAAGSPAQVGFAVDSYLAAHPGSERHLTLIRIGAVERVTREGPSAFRALRPLPRGQLGTLSTVDSPAGPLRVLSAPLSDGTEQIGVATFLGPLDGVRFAAMNALVRIALAGAAGLVAGGVVLALAVRNALRPVGDLARAARSVGGKGESSRVPEPRRLDEVGVLASEFNRMLDRMRADAEQRRSLLSAVSHELRTPLAVAEGHLEVFETLGPAGGATAADTARVVRGELDRLRRIVDDLSAITVGDGGRITELAPVFAPDVLDALCGRIDALGLAGVRVAQAPAAVLLGDEDHIAQALVNLVFNATTHNPPGTAVRVMVRGDAETVAFTVTDDGPGIDPAVRDRVFEPFVTTRTGGARRASGLGLAVVRAVTEAQGGHVHLSSSPAGTTVELTFPAATGEA